MKSTTNRARAKRRPSPSAKGPLSVPLPRSLRTRLDAVARKRQIKTATAARILLDERLGELEDAVELSRSEEWQRQQAWATWDKIQAGDTRDVAMERFRAFAADAIRRTGARSARR